MPSLQLENSSDTLDLGSIAGVGQGFAALKSASGFGLPPISNQWLSGAGDGAVFRGGRVLPRDIDLPVLVAAPNRPALTMLGTRLSRMMAGQMTLRFVEDDGSSWTLSVRRDGGGDLTLGDDTDGRTIASTVITLRAGDPYWTSGTLTTRKVVASTGRGLIGQLSKLQLSASQTIGAIQMENVGDADAYPVWTVTGPGHGFSATSSTGESFALPDVTLADGEQRIIDTRAGTMVDQDGVNRYTEFGTAPQLWRVPSGTTTAHVTLIDTTPDSSIVAQWFARKWSII